MRVGDGAECAWELTTGDTTVNVTQSVLCNQARFRTAWHAATGDVVCVKQSEWHEAIKDWWRRAEVVEAPSLDSLIWSALEDFCTDSRAMDIDELLNGLPYTDEDNITWLKVADFRLYLMVGRYPVTLIRIWGVIRANCKPQQKIVTVKGKSLRVCGVPAFEEQNKPLSVPKAHPEEDF